MEEKLTAQDNVLFGIGIFRGVEPVESGHLFVFLGRDKVPGMQLGDQPEAEPGSFEPDVFMMCIGFPERNHVFIELNIPGHELVGDGFDTVQTQGTDVVAVIVIADFTAPAYPAIADETFGSFFRVFFQTVEGPFGLGSGPAAGF